MLQVITSQTASSSRAETDGSWMNTSASQSSMAEYEAEQEAEKEDVHEYVKGQAMNIGEEV